VLRLYQVKCGDINRRKWRESYPQLEEMFQVPWMRCNYPHHRRRTEGFLVTNGHAIPNVEPVMNGWFAEQERDHGRSISFMHLDRLVDWIFKSQLVSEFRTALREEGINIMSERA
jgi:hypothetical protein